MFIHVGIYIVENHSLIYDDDIIGPDYKVY